MMVDVLEQYRRASSTDVPVLLCPLSPTSVAFGMRKALMAEQGKADMEQRILDLEAEKRELEQEVALSAQGAG